MRQDRLSRPCVLLLVAAIGAGISPRADGADRDDDPSRPREVVVFAGGQDGYHTYRIPAVIADAGGSLLAFAEGRKDGASDTGNIDVVLRRSRDGGATWGPLQLVVDAGPDTIGNPCPLLDRATGRIWLPLTRNPGRDTNDQNKTGTGTGTREVFLCSSDDRGATWSAPSNITASVKRQGWTWYATGPGCGIQLADGRLLVPCNHRVGADRDSRSHVIFSDDHGATWQVGGAAERGTNECQVVELDDGALLLNMRSQHGRKRRAIAKSHDRGATWSKLGFDEALVEPACQASLIRVPGQADGAGVLLFANPASTKRERMTVRLSRDRGRTWPASRVLHDGSAGYSSLVATPGEQVGCLYEKDRSRTIVFARFGLEWLADGRDQPVGDRPPKE